MWMMTRYGFYSAVAKGQQGCLSVRARTRAHIDALKLAHPALDAYKVQVSTNTDYKYRLVLPRPVWEQVVLDETQRIDYANFKGEVGKHGDNAYLDALHRVWEVMMRLQVNENVDPLPRVRKGKR